MRRRSRRRIGYRFKETYLKPRGIPLNTLVQTTLTFEELESLRLRYIEKLDQVKAAKKMNISQSQYQRDLTTALEKITNALINESAIKIEKPIAKPS
jgi:predicted DNA-binding protein (UPF0251 family)